MKSIFAATVPDLYKMKTSLTPVTVNRIINNRGCEDKYDL
jgi:hypothetical protein